jgi:phosphoribosyl-ATP pyrophosphohydrolase
VDRLAEMFTRQAALQRYSYNVNFKEMSVEVEDRAEYVRMNTLAGIVELTEALNETGWKTWATNRDYDATKVISEIVDAWHFMMNIMLASGIEPETLASLFFDKYVVKNRRNAERQEEGYDGVSTKCPHCSRALDDVGVNQGRILGELAFECGGCHKSLPVEMILGADNVDRMKRITKILNTTT